MRALTVAAAVAAAALAGCAKAPTVIDTEVDADATTPPLLLLRMTVASTSDPARQASSSLRSLVRGVDGGRPGPFSFPLLLAISADPVLAGAVTITVEGLDWDSFAVLASGQAAATVVAEQHTRALLTLGAVASGPGDGGVD